MSDRAAPARQLVDPRGRGTSLGTVRQVWAQRDSAPNTLDLLYVLYIVVLTVLVAGVPVLRSAGMVLARPDVLPLLLAPTAATLATALLPALGAGAVLLGGVRGPALLAPFFTVTLAGSALPRRRVLLRPFARSCLVPVLALGIGSGLLGATLMQDGRADGGDIMIMVLGGVGGGLILAALWLVGEVLGPWARRLLGAVLGAIAVLSTWMPGPMLLGAVGPGGSSAGRWSLGLLAAGSIAVLGAVELLDRLRAEVLLDQARRWDAATSIATTGDLVGAGGIYRALPGIGRGLPAIGGGPLPWIYARRDLIGWLRMPQRVLGGLAAIGVGAFLLGVGEQLRGPVGWAGICAGALIMWLGTEPVTSGIRHAVHTLGAPTLFGQRAGAQALWHLPAPSAAVALAGLLGAVAGSLAAAGSAPLTAMLLAPLFVLARAWNAAKGPMPVSLISTPMPTPQGDASVIPVLVWQSDAVLLAMICGALLALASGAGPMWLVAAAVVLLGGIAAMTRSRWRALRDGEP